MMITIIPADQVVLVNAIPARGISMSNIPNNVHAIQWNGESGHLELKDPTTGQMISNTPISSVDAYLPQITQWISVIQQQQQAHLAALANLTDQIHMLDSQLQQTHQSMTSTQDSLNMKTQAISLIQQQFSLG